MIPLSGPVHRTQILSPFLLRPSTRIGVFGHHEKQVFENGSYRVEVFENAGSRLHMDGRNPANALEYNDVKHHILLTFTHAQCKECYRISSSGEND